MSAKVLASIALGVVLILVAGPVGAQGVRFGVSGGPTLSFADGGGTDPHAMATLGLGGSVDKPLGFRVDGMWRFLEHGELLIGTGNVVYAIRVSEAPPVVPYLIGGAGIYHIGQEDSRATASSASTAVRASWSRSVMGR